MVTAIALSFCLLAGFWTASMQTLALVTVAVIISVAIAFPLGVLASRYRKFEAAIRPVLDIMQTVPPWVYLIPAVMIFSLGRVPAIIATIVYGIPPMLRLTTLAFNQVPKDLLELGQATGASPRSILFKIEIPSATPTLLVGLNQCILLSLAMVVLAGLVGAGGLGAEVTRGLTRMEMGLGLGPACRSSPSPSSSTGFPGACCSAARRLAQQSPPESQKDFPCAAVSSA